MTTSKDAFVFKKELTGIERRQADKRCKTCGTSISIFGGYKCKKCLKPENPNIRHSIRH